MKKKLDFVAFTKAVAEMKLGEGLESAALHHSAINVKDWDRIQAELTKVISSSDQKPVL